MRIIAGRLKGTILHLPKDKSTRPLKDLVRESIFNLLSHSNKISLKLENSNILDLYTFGPNNCFAIDKIVLVFPVPDGPYNNKFGKSSLSNTFNKRFFTDSCV